MAEKANADAVPRLGEADIIARYFAPLAEGVSGAFGLRDDAALMTPAPGEELVVTTDTIVEGVHFLENAAAADVAAKALGVNVSDLAAKGADPRLYVLSLALPATPDEGWLAGFHDGLAAAQARFGCALAGGDTVATPGPLTVSVTALGTLPEGEMVHRSGAHTGERVYVSGTIGDAGLGLRLLTDDAAAGRWGLDADATAWLAGRYLRPEPRVALAPVLCAHATAAMDVSDGLFGDFEKLCAASGTGGRIMAAEVPLSAPARTALEHAPDLLATLVTCGDDYEVLATVPLDQAEVFEAAAQAANVPVTAIGTIEPASQGVTVLSAAGEPLALDRDSYDHFLPD